MRSPARRRSSRTAAWTSWPPTSSHAPCTQSCSADPTRPHNHARFSFLNPRAHDLYPDWERGANDAVALLRAEAGRDPYDRELTDLIGELSTRSEEFRARWADHNVRLHQTGTKRFHHPVVGELDARPSR